MKNGVQLNWYALYRSSPWYSHSFFQTKIMTPFEKQTRSDTMPVICLPELLSISDIWVFCLTACFLLKSQREPTLLFFSTKDERQLILIIPLGFKIELLF